MITTVGAGPPPLRSRISPRCGSARGTRTGSPPRYCLSAELCKDSVFYQNDPDLSILQSFHKWHGRVMIQIRRSAVGGLAAQSPDRAAVVVEARSGDRGEARCLASSVTAQTFGTGRRGFGCTGLAKTSPASANTCGGRDQPFGLAPGYLAGTHSTCIADPFDQAVWLFLVNDRADHGVRLVGVTDLDGPNAIRKAFHKRVVDTIVDDEPVDAHADLALVQKLAEDRCLQDVIDVGIVQHDKRAVAAQLEFEAL